MEKVRVLMITYEGNRYFEEQLNSVLSQDQLESLHIYDDASSPQFQSELIQYAKKASASVHLNFNEVNLGVLGNIKKAISENEDAKYIAFADQDDVWYPSKLAQTLAEIKRIEATNVPCCVSHDMHIVDEFSALRKGTFWNYKGYDIHTTDHIFTNLIKHVVIGSATLINQNMARHLLNMPAGLPFYHDAWMTLIAHSIGRYSAIHEPLSAHRTHQASLTFSVQNQMGLREKIKRNWKLLTGKDSMFKEQFIFANSFYHMYRDTLPNEIKNQFEEFLNLQFGGYFTQKRYLYKRLKR